MHALKYLRLVQELLLFRQVAKHDRTLPSCSVAPWTRWTTRTVTISVSMTICVSMMMTTTLTG